MPKRSYTKEDRAASLAALAANGGNLAKTARQVGVPRKTLAEWAKGQPAQPAGGTRGGPDPPPKKSVADEAAEAAPAACGALADRLDAIASKIVDALPQKIDGAGLQPSAIALGILIEKARLLRGLPTSITREASDLTDGELEAIVRGGDHGQPPGGGGGTAPPAAGP